MARKIYVQEPKLVVPIVTDPPQVVASYGVLDWEEGQLAIENLPAQNDGCRIDVFWGDDINVLRQRALDKVMAFFGVGSNDVIFLGGWV